MTSECNKEIDLSLMDKVFDKYYKENGNIVSMLQDAQDIYGYLPLDVLKAIADRTGNKRTKVYGVATFYSQFRLNPRGKYMILQCQGTACHVNNSEIIGNAICDELGINPEETSSDGMFSFEHVACLGCCSLAPVIMINGEAYGNLTPDKVRKIIRDIYAREKEEAI